MVLVCGTLATLFTLKGGMNSVIYTDFMQSIVLVGGALLATIYCCVHVPGGIMQPEILRSETHLSTSLF